MSEKRSGPRAVATALEPNGVGVPGGTGTSIPFRRAPHNLEAEQALLGAILVNNVALDHVAAFLKASDFFDPLHQQIYSAAMTLVADGRKATPITLRTFFENAEPIEPGLSVPQYLGKLSANTSATAISARDYGRTIHDLATRRQLIVIGQDIENAAYDAPVDFSPQQQLAEAEARLSSLAASMGQEPGKLLFADEMPVTTSSDGPVATLIGPSSLNVWFGPSGGGKSALAIDCAYAIATGCSWLGLQTLQGAVLYIPLEGRPAFGARLAAVRARRGPAGRRLAVLDADIVLGRSNGAGTVGVVVAAARRLAAAAQSPVRMIVVDTYARALAGDDENEASTVSAVLHQLGRISGATGAAVLLIHHPGKDSGRGPRGSNALYAAADTVLEIERNGDAPLRTIVARKRREGPEETLGTFGLEVVDVGRSDDGRPVTACVVVAQEIEAEAVSSSRPRGRKAKLPASAQIAFDALRYAVEEVGASPVSSSHIPSTVKRVVLLTQWRDYAYRKGITSSSEPRARQQAFDRGQQRLIADGLVGVWDPYAWVASP